jgi:hypothetical protein
MIGPKSAQLLFPWLLLAACGDPVDGTGGGSSESTGSSTSESVPTTGETGETGGEVTGSSTGEPACECVGDQACIGGACLDVGREDLARGCNVLGDPAGRGQCLYPWPADVLLPSADTPTGLRLAYDPALLPTNDKGAPFAADEVTAGFDGFSPLSQIRFAFAATVDADGLAGIDDIKGSLAEDATIVLLEASTGERWPYFAELDAAAEPGEPVTVFVRPARRLRPGQSYVVAVRGLKSGGAEIAAPPLFAALRDDLSTDVPELEAIRGGFAAVFGPLAAAGVDRAGLQLAWSFTTATEEALTRDFTAIAPQVEAIAGAGDLGYVIEEVDEDPDPALARVIRGRFTVPNCLTNDGGPGERMKRGDDGLPDCSGTTEAPFVIAIPQAILAGGEPAPLTVYGHGLLGSGEEAVSIAKRATTGIVAGTDFWGLSQEDLPEVVTVLGDSLANGRTLPDRLIQSAVNFTTLAYLARGALLSAPELQADDTTSLIDPDKIVYLGGSQGGIMGGTVMAMAPPLRRGVLVVGGANYSLMIWRSTAFSQLGEIWKGSHRDPQDREFLFALFQSAFDLADPLTFAEFLDAPLDGGEARRVLLVESMGDAQVPNIATETMARTLGLTMLAPAVTSVAGLVESPGPLTSGSALLQIDTKLGPVPPGVNLPLDADNGAHGAAVDDPSAIAMIEQFLVDGVIENLCDGPCDPG